MQILEKLETEIGEAFIQAHRELEGNLRSEESVGTCSTVLGVESSTDNHLEK